MVNKQYVYLITLDWATEDDKGFEFDICSTPKKAFEIFRKRIKAEKNTSLKFINIILRPSSSRPIIHQSKKAPISITR